METLEKLLHSKLGYPTEPDFKGALIGYLPYNCLWLPNDSFTIQI